MSCYIIISRGLLACVIGSISILYYYNDPFYSVLDASETIELEFAGGLFVTSLVWLEIVIRVNCNIDGASVKRGLLERWFETEISPIHRSTSTVHYRVFKRRLAGASLFKGGVHVRTTTTCTLSAMSRPSR